MRIAHTCTKFNRISETFIYDLIVGLERAGTENHVLTAARVNVTERPFPRVHVLPVPLWQQVAFAIRKHWLNVYHFPLPPQAAREELQNIRPDVILAHFGGMGAAVAPLAHEMGIPLVVVFHAFDLFMRQFRPATYKALWDSGAQAVVVSEHGKRRLLELGCPAERVRVIHCGVDVSRFAAADRQPGVNGLRLVTIGRFVEKKGFDDLIRAVGAIRGRTTQPVRLDLWGDGPLRRPLEALANELGLMNAVTFRGIAASQDVPQLLRRYDAFVLPSKTARDGDTEGIPITILEAQAAGLPVVATLHGGIPEAIPPGNHDLLAREGDVRDLTERLTRLAARRNEWAQIGLRGREWVSREFSLENEIAAYLDLFRSVLAPSASRPPPSHGGGSDWCP
jgi:colanic acid/amylovoran biosynthesis glycosyltransferase